MSFPTYEHFKDSGFQWLGKVPDSWEVNVSRRYFYEIREPGKFDDVQLSATQKFGVVPQTMFMELEDQKVVLALKGLSNFKHVEPDDFVISLRSFQGGIERSKYQGCVSPAYTVLRPKRIIDPTFISYLFKSAGYIVALQSVTDGIREGKNIKYDQFAELGLALPPITEQKSIALFLDHEIAKIDTLVVQQVKLIELLKEKRKSIISHTVTKGLDPKVKMKDSGVTWLGDIPEHWELKKIKWCAKLKNEKTSDRSNTIALENIESWTGRFIDTESEFEGDGVKFNEGDVLFGKLRPYLAKVFRATMSGEAIGDFFVLEPNKNLLSQFAERLFISSEFIDAINSSTYGTKMPRVNWEYFSSMSIPLPPKHEQIQISNYLVTAIEEMDKLIATSINAVDLLEERRSALISAAVTGQIDVRNYQPKEVA